MIPTTKRRAFTMVEVLIACAIMAILMTALSGSLLAMSNAARANDAEMRARQNTSNVLNLMLAKIRRSKEITLLSPTSTNEYAKLVTLDSGTWDSMTQTYTNCTWTTFTLQAQTLQVGTGATTTPSTSAVLHAVRSLVFRSVPAGTSLSTLTVEITLDVPDPFNSIRTVPYTVAGTTTVRCRL